MSTKDIMKEYAGQWPEGKGMNDRRNDVITQGYINGHMVRVVIAGGGVLQYHVVIGLNAALGNTEQNPRYKEIPCRPLFNSALEAWDYGHNIALGAGPLARND